MIFGPAKGIILESSFQRNGLPMIKIKTLAAAAAAGLSCLAAAGAGGDAGGLDVLETSPSSISIEWPRGKPGEQFSVYQLHERTAGEKPGDEVWAETFEGAPGNGQGPVDDLDQVTVNEGWEGEYVMFSSQESSLRLSGMDGGWLLSPGLNAGTCTGAVICLREKTSGPRENMQSQRVMTVSDGGTVTNLSGTVTVGSRFENHFVPLPETVAGKTFRILLTAPTNHMAADIDIMSVSLRKNYVAGSVELVQDAAVATTNNCFTFEGLVPREYTCRVESSAGADGAKNVLERKVNLLNAPSGEKSITVKMLFLVLQIGLIVFAAKLGGMLAQWLKMPSVIGELGAGVLIGPYALGKIGFTIGGFTLFSKGIFPLPPGGAEFPVSPELYGICTIASVVLLFLSGVETNFKMFLRYSFAGLIIGVGGVVVSFLFGNWCASLRLPGIDDTLLHYFIPIAMFENLSMFSPPALFMGILGTATSVGITARILSERRKMDSQEGVTIMASAVIDDVLGIVVLAIGLGVIKSNASAGGAGAAQMQWGQIGAVAAKAFGVWLIGTVLGLVAARKISFILKLFKSPVAVATLSFGLALVIASIFQAMDLSLIIGAYVLGLALSRTDIRHLVQENLQSIYTFFVPIFFCVMGMLVDLSQLTSADVLIFGGIYTVLSVAAKIIGCAVPALFCGFNAVGGLRIGAGMIPRGEVALIIAGLGLSMGYLDSKVFGIGIMMTLVTTLVSPPLLVHLFNINRKGVKKDCSSTEGSRPVSFELDTESAARIMAQRLVHAFQNEGFFTSLLNASENIWQVSKDVTEITMRRSGKRIEFECTPEEESFVGTAIIEICTEMNALANQFSRPLKSGEIASILKEGQSAKISGSSDILHYIRRFVAIPDFNATSVEDMVDKLIKAISDVNPGVFTDAAKVKEAIMFRENAMSTGLDHGLAVPHGRTDFAKDLAGAIAIVGNENGIPGYPTIDNGPVRIIALTVAPAESATPHLRVMSYLSKKLRENDGLARLLACKTPSEMMKFLIY